MAHARIGIYEFRPGGADEVIRKASTGMLAIWSKQPGFMSYTIVKTGEESAISISTWATGIQAEEAVASAASWVQANVAPLVVSVQNYLGDVALAEQAR